jgi:DNA-binding beta-propeller fold protein YncE
MKRFLFPFPSSWPVGRKARARSLVSAFILVSAFFINLVFADYGDVTYLAGTLQSFGLVDGTGTNVKFYNPFGVAISPDATYALIPEANNNVIRKMIISTSAVTVFAGNPSGSSGSADGVGTNVYFNSLETLSFSSDGSYALIADRWNFCVRKIIVSTITVTTFVGTSSGIANGVGTNAQFDDSYGICLAPNGVFAITVDFSSHLVRYIEISTATVSTLAGNAYNASSTNGVGTNVGFNYPRGVSISPDSSYVLIADTANNLIRMIVISTTQVTTLAGGAYGYANGVGTNAMFKSPRGLSISPYGSYVLVADLENNMIRRIMISTGKVTVLAGYPSSGSSNGIGTNARFSGPNGISISPSGNFALVADLDNQFFRRLDIIIADYGDVSFLAGSLQTTGLANGVGTNAQFRNPATCAISPDETYTLVADWVNRAIRKIIISTGSVILFAGSPSGGTGTTNGDGTNALFYNPLAISFFPDGNSALIADTSNNRIRKITTATASVTTFAGSSTGSNNGAGTSAKFDNPYGVSIAPNGIFAIVVDYMTSLIRYIDISTVVVSTLAGSAYSYSSTNGIGTIARFDHPRAASISPDSRYILVSDTSNNLIRKIVVSTAQVTTLAGSAYGYANGVGTNAMFKSSRGLSISPYGDYVLIGDLDNNMIRRIAIATGEMSDFVGSLATGYANGIGTNAQFRGAHGVTISPSGNFALVTDLDNQLIRRVDIVDNQPTPSSAPTSPHPSFSPTLPPIFDPVAVVSTLVGSTAGTNDGVGTSAKLNQPYGLGLSRDDSFCLIAENAVNRVRKVVISTSSVTTIVGSSWGFSNGVGTSALLKSPLDVDVSLDGSYALILDQGNFLVRSVNLTSLVVTVLAGTLSRGTANGVGTAASFDDSYGLTISPDGTYALIAEFGSSSVRKLVITTAEVSLFAGSPTGAEGYANGIGSNAIFNRLYGVAFSPDGLFVLVVEADNNLVRKVVISTAEVSVFAGNTSLSSGMTNGIGTMAAFKQPYRASFSPDGTYALVADNGNRMIRTIEIQTLSVSLLAGDPMGNSGSSNGVGTSASFSSPSDVKISSDGTFALVVDRYNHQIRKVLLVATAEPTVSPTRAPTFSPSTSPTLQPSATPTTRAPTFSPSTSPTLQPSATPTTRAPTFSPSTSPTLQPSATPTTRAPTFSPSTSPTLVPSAYPTSPPTSSPSSQPTPHSTVLTCPPFTTESTSNATENTIACWFWLCPYESVTISLCGSCNSTDTLIRLFDSDGVEVSWNDDGAEGGCGHCSSLSYVYDASTVRCDKLTLQQGCRSSESCVGESQITIESTTDELVKYGFGVSFGDSSILSPSRGLLVNYFLNPARG